MSKKLSKVLMATLAVAFAFCMAIATLGVFTTKAAVSTGDIVMLDSAQVRQTGEMGIRFTATISESDYETLSAQGAEFGMILAPADWVENDDDLAFGSSALSLYDGTQGVGDKYFAQGINIPVQDVNDFDGDGDRAEYLLTCSFVKIKTTNFDRNFKARAYYKVDGEYYHSENVVERNIFTVASKAYADGEMEDEVVETYLAGIISEVAKEYTTVNATITGDDNGTIAKNGELSVTATVSNGSKTLDAGVQLFVTKSGDVVEDALSFNAQTGKYTVATAGKFTVVAKIGNTVVAEKELTVAREGEVTITFKPAKAVNNSWQDIVPLDDVTKITYQNLQTSDNYVSELGYNVVLLAEVNDPENPDVTALTQREDFVLDCDTDWLKLGKFGHLVYVCADRYKAIDPVSTITAKYVDAYGLEYTASLPIYGREESHIATFGKTEDFTATDALHIEVANNEWVTIQNVDFTNQIADNLIRFTLLNKGLTAGVRTRSWCIRVSESGNPSNYVNIVFGKHNAGYLCLAMQAPGWTRAVAVRDMHNGTGTSINDFKSYPDDYGMGCAYDGILLLNGIDGVNQYTKDPANYRKEMVGFSIVNSEIWYSEYNGLGWNDAGRGLNVAPLFSKARQAELKGTTGSAGYKFDGDVYSGLDNVTKVDISICPMNGGNSTMVIDQLGGKNVTADMLNNIYYSHINSSEGEPYAVGPRANA